MHRLFKWTVVPILGWIALVASPQADAGFRIRIDNGGNTGVVIGDGETGDSNPNLGAITFIGAIGDFSITVSTGVSNPTAGTTKPGNIAELDLNVLASSNKAGTLRISLEDTDYSSLGFNGALGLLGEVGGVAGGSISVQGWGNPDNVAPAYGKSVSAPGALDPLGGVPVGAVPVWTPAFVAGSGSFSDTAISGMGPASKFALFIQVVVTHATSATTSFNETLTVTPAPGGMTLALSALPVLGLGMWRPWRRKR